MLTSPRKTLLAVFVPLLLAFAPPAVQSGDRALLIGINKYEDTRIPSLKGTANDLQDFRTMLIQQLHFKESEILPLENEKATHDSILNAIDDWLVKGSAPGDRVVLYYSGHGEQTPDTNGDEDDKLDEALVAHDADLITHKNYVLDDEINLKIQALKGREVLAVIDSCHSGTVTRGLSDESYADAKTPGPVGLKALSSDGRGVGERSALDDSSALSIGGISRGEQDKAHQTEGNFLTPAPQLTAFFAVSPKQLALENKLDREHPHGVFTGAFVEGVNGKGDKDGDGRVSFAELLDYVRVLSEEYCQANKSKCTEGLTPNMETDSSKAGQDFLSFGLPVNHPAPIEVTDLADSLLAHTSHAQLSLRMLPGQSIALKQELGYEFSADHDGKLVLFDINTQGKVTQIFPNRYTPKNKYHLAWVYAHRPVAIPGHLDFKLRAVGETGKGKLVAVLIEDDVDTDDLIQLSSDPFRVIDNPTQWLAKLSERLNKAFHEPDGKNRAIRWSMTSLDYEITPER